MDAGTAPVQQLSALLVEARARVLERLLTVWKHELYSVEA